MKSRSSLGAAVFALFAAMCSPFKEDPAGVGGPDGGVEPGVRSDLVAQPGHPADSGGDAASGAACDLRQPFGPPVFVSGLSIPKAAWVGGLRLSPDNLTAYFYADGSPDATSADQHLYTATRSTSDSAFDHIAPIEGDGIDTSGSDEFFPTVSGDGLDLVFSRFPRGDTRGSLHSATRAAPWAPFTYQGTLMSDPVRSLNCPFLRQDGHVLYLSSVVPNADGDIYRAMRAGSTFAQPLAVAELNTAYEESSPVITPDDLTIYWLSERPDGNAQGSGDVWTAHRTSTDEAFGAAQNVSEVNSPAADRPTFVTSDGCTLYLTRYVRTEDLPYGQLAQYVARKPL